MMVLSDRSTAQPIQKTDKNPTAAKRNAIRSKTSFTSGWCLSAGAWMRPTAVYLGNGGIYRTVEKHGHIIDSLLTSH
jgi:hypothetical protein